MKSNISFIFDDDAPLVYFVVDTQELFKMNLDEGGLYSALQEAFRASKEEVPVATGLMKRAYTFKRLNNHSIMCSFPPDKIVGKVRAGKIVKEYYPAYLKDTVKRANWLDIVMKRFLDTLKRLVNTHNKKENIKVNVPTIVFLEFLRAFNKQYKEKLKLALELKQEASRKYEK